MCSCWLARTCRSMEVESSPDADAPRPIGVGLLLCMLEHGGEVVARVLIALAKRAQEVCLGEAGRGGRR